jgi:hypothetical protein
MIWDLPPKIWLPAKPAIIRPAPVQKASFLPGMFPGLMMAASSAAAILFFDSAVSTDDTITVPPNIQAGDLLVLADIGQDFGAVTPATPTDFTALASFTPSATTAMVVSYKEADGSEGSTSIAGIDPVFANKKALAVFRRSPAATMITPSTVNSEGTTGNPSSQNVAASGGDAPLVVIAAYYGTGGVDPRTFTPAAGGEINPDTILFLKFRIYNSAPQDTTVDMDDEGTNGLVSCYLQMA